MVKAEKAMESVIQETEKERKNKRRKEEIIPPTIHTIKK
jgi:hypothetical protein